MRAIVYDTGALLAAESRNPDFLGPARRAHRRAHRPRHPRRRRGPGPGAADPSTRSPAGLKGCDELPDDRGPGLACAASRTADVVATIVITTAVRHQAPVVTGDPGDLTRIADSIGVQIRIFAT